MRFALKINGTILGSFLVIFELEEGDTLFVFGGTKAEVAAGSSVRLGTGTGVGVSSAFGGWVDASCDPMVNPSGCLTFVFETDNDNNKGKGWEAWVSCSERAVELGNVSIPNRQLAFDKAYSVITIPSPEVKACGEILPTASDSVQVIIRNQFGTIFIDTVLTNTGSISSVTDTFAIGIYAAEYILKSDPHPSKRKTVTFSVQAPALVCDDEVNISIGSSCLIQINPDDILENVGDTITDTLYYNITLVLGSGKNKVIKTTKNVDNHGAISYPAITYGDIKKAGMDICGARAEVKIERIYYGIGGVETIINNGAQRSFCHTEVFFEDKSPPYISIDAEVDTLITCDTFGLAALLNPRVIDNCEEAITDIKIKVTMGETDPCLAYNGKPDTTTATVSFFATDACGNEGKTSRVITIIRPDMKKHIAKVKDLRVDCNEERSNVTFPGLKIGTYHKGRFDAKDTISLSTEEYICGYILTKRDLEVDAGHCGKKVYRYWSALDWCDTYGAIPVDTQLIRFADTTAPIFVANQEQLIHLEIGAFDCTYDITRLTTPEAKDNCSAPTVRLDSVFRVEDNSLWGVPVSLHTKLDADTFQLRWVAEDACYEQRVNDTLVQTVIIKDVTRPTAISTDQLNVSIGTELATIHAEDVNAGSYDFCGIAKIEIKRDSSKFGPTVTFTCKDVNDTITITMRVTDINGNENSTWLTVIPEDKIRPICQDFPTGISYANGNARGNTSQVFIDCNDLKVAAIRNTNQPSAAELAAIGGPLPDPLDNCSDVRNIELSPRIVRTNDCGLNIYERRWIAADGNGFESLDTCMQLITVNYREDWQIIFPEDVTLNCPDTVQSDSVIIINGSCDRLAVNVDTKVFNVVEDACFKVVKTYNIINWCNYTPGAAPTHNFNKDNYPKNGILRSDSIPNFSYITYTQIIKVNDQEGPKPVIGDVGECIYGAHDSNSVTFGDTLECGETKTFTAVATDCVTNVGGVLQHSYKLYRGNISEMLAGRAFEVREAAGKGEGNAARMDGVVQSGTYTAEFVFTDNCGNSTVQRKEFTFIDCRKPTPYCLNGIAVEIPNDWGVDVWANDFDQGSYDNCATQDSLRFRIWHLSLGFLPPTTVQGVLDSLPASITFDCNALGTQIVNVYVIDESDNFDYCSTYALIQDNMNECRRDSLSGESPTTLVAGNILNTTEQHIENVNVAVNGGIQESMVTGTDGHFQFMLPGDGDYTLIPEKDENPLNGVSTYDLVLMSKHILGIAPFEAPYQYIAADVNKSGTITAFDMVQLRQLILNITSEFPNNSSWRFVDADYNFTTDNPAAENFDEIKQINDLKGEMLDADFIGIKIGDVNGNALVNSLLQIEERNRISTLNLIAKDRFVTTGEQVSVDFIATNISEAQGYQFTMNFEGLELVELVEGVAKAANFNTQITERGLLTSSWNGRATATDVLFQLIFKATESGKLSDFIYLSSDITSAEAYNEIGELMNISLELIENREVDKFELYQNSPNPFQKETVIGFNLPKAGPATLKVLDIQGKVIKSLLKECAKGYNEIRLKTSQLNAAGVLYYQLETAKHTLTKKMIIIE